MAAGHPAGADAVVVEEQRKVGDTVGRGDIKRTLSSVAKEGVHTIQGERVIHIAGPIGESGVSLPAGGRQSGLGDRNIRKQAVFFFCSSRGRTGGAAGRRGSSGGQDCVACQSGGASQSRTLEETTA